MTRKGLSWCAYFPDDGTQAITREPEIFELLRADNVRLRAEIERLKAALQQIVLRYETAEDGWPAEDMRSIAKAAPGTQAMTRDPPPPNASHADVWLAYMEARAEIERLKHDLHHYDALQTAFHTLRAAKRDLHAEVARWKTEVGRLLKQVADLAFAAAERTDEIERLKAALLEIEREATAVRPPRLSWFGERARAALEPKP